MTSAVRCCTVLLQGDGGTGYLAVGPSIATIGAIALIAIAVADAMAATVCTLARSTARGWRLRCRLWRDDFRRIRRRGSWHGCVCFHRCSRSCDSFGALTASPHGKATTTLCCVIPITGTNTAIVVATMAMVIARRGGALRLDAVFDGEAISSTHIVRFEDEQHLRSCALIRVALGDVALQLGDTIGRSVGAVVDPQNVVVLLHVEPDQSSFEVCVGMVRVQPPSACHAVAVLPFPVDLEESCAVMGPNHPQAPVHAPVAGFIAVVPIVVESASLTFRSTPETSCAIGATGALARSGVARPVVVAIAVAVAVRPVPTCSAYTTGTININVESLCWATALSSGAAALGVPMAR